MASIVHYNYTEPDRFKEGYHLSIRYIIDQEERKDTLKSMTEWLHDQLKIYLKKYNIQVINRLDRFRNMSGVQIRLSNKFTIVAFYLPDMKIHTVMYKSAKMVTSPDFRYTVENSPMFLSIGMLAAHLEYLKMSISSNTLSGLNTYKVNVKSLRNN